MTSRWQDDEELLAQVADAARTAGPVPEPVLRGARAAFAGRLPERGRVLATLSYDSVLDDELALRGPEPDGRRVITFDAGSVSVEIELTADRLVGQLVPPMAGAVELLTADGPGGRTAADEVGCFVLALPGPGPVRFRCDVAGGVVVTDWVRL